MNDIFSFLFCLTQTPTPCAKACKTLPYLPLWWGWAPDCCRRTAGQPLQSVSSWCWARMGWAPTRFGYIPKAGSAQTPDLTAGPLLSVPLNPSDSLLMIFLYPASAVSPPPLTSSFHLCSRPKSAVSCALCLRAFPLVPSAAVRRRHTFRQCPPHPRDPNRPEASLSSQTHPDPPGKTQHGRRRRWWPGGVRTNRL